MDQAGPAILEPCPEKAITALHSRVFLTPAATGNIWPNSLIGQKTADMIMLCLGFRHKQACAYTTKRPRIALQLYNGETNISKLAPHPRNRLGQDDACVLSEKTNVKRVWSLSCPRRKHGVPPASQKKQQHMREKRDLASQTVVLARVARFCG